MFIRHLDLRLLDVERRAQRLLGDKAVSYTHLVVAPVDEVQEIGYGDGRLGGVKGQFNVPRGGGDDDIDVLEASSGCRRGCLLYTSGSPW